MRFRQKKDPVLDPEQHELLENAQRRIRQKKKLYRHIVLFLIGGVFLVGINKVLKVGATHDWYLWALIAWGFFLAVHTAQVYFLDPLTGKQWERAQREKLLRKQQEKIRKLEAEIARAHPLPQAPEPLKNEPAKDE